MSRYVSRHGVRHTGCGAQPLDCAALVKMRVGEQISGRFLRLFPDLRAPLRQPSKRRTPPAFGNRGRWVFRTCRATYGRIAPYLGQSGAASESLFTCKTRCSPVSGFSHRRAACGQPRRGLRGPGRRHSEFAEAVLRLIQGGCPPPSPVASIRGQIGRFALQFVPHVPHQ